MPEENADALLLYVVDKIRQEIEDMAYDKLRSVLSDFSLEGSDLDDKLREHKLYIKEKAREIVKKRLAEHKILLTEEEFWCLCGKYKSLERKDKKQPLFDVPKPVLAEFSEFIKPSIVIESCSSNDLSSLMKPTESALTAKSIKSQKDKVIDQGEKKESDEMGEKTFSKVEDDSKSLSEFYVSKKSDGFLDTISPRVSALQELDQKEKDIQKLDQKDKGIQKLDQRDKDIQKLDQKDKDILSIGAKSKSSSRKQIGTEQEMKKEEQQAPNLGEIFFKDEGVRNRVLQLKDNIIFKRISSQLPASEDLKPHTSKVSDAPEIEASDLKEDKFEIEDELEITTVEDIDSQKLPDGLKYDDELGLYGEDFYVSTDKNYSWITKFLDDLINAQHMKAVSDLLAEKLESVSGEPSQKKSESRSFVSLLTSTSSSLSEEDLEYLQDTFGVVLELALAEVTLKMPSSPIPYIAQYLQFYKIDKKFDTLKRKARVDIDFAKKELENSKNKFLSQKKELIRLGEELEDTVLKSKNVYLFTLNGKVTQGRGRRIRRDIVHTCDKLLEKTPLFNLGKKLRRLYTFKSVFGYFQTMIKPLERESALTKYHSTQIVYNKIAEFLNPILPDIVPVLNVVDSKTNICTNEVLKDFMSEYALYRGYKDPSQHPAAMQFKGKYRSRPSEYPCVDNIRNQYNYVYKCYKRYGDFTEQMTKDTVLYALTAKNKPLKKIKHITKEEACAMCAEVPNIINFFLEQQKVVEDCLIHYMTSQYISTSIESMYDEHHKYILAAKRQDIRILEDILKVVERALCFEDPSDCSRAKEQMRSHIVSLISKQKYLMSRFKYDERDAAVEEFQKQVMVLAQAAKCNRSELPCECEANSKMEKTSEQSWSDDEDGVLDDLEQKRLYKIMNKVADMISKVKLSEKSIQTIEHILKAFITRASRKYPYLSKRAHYDLKVLLDCVVTLYMEKTEQTSDENVEENTHPCLCKYLMQVSGIFVAIHSRMVKSFEEYRKSERDELELEIMRMFASFVDGLTVEKIQKQNLCVSNL